MSLCKSIAIGLGVGLVLGGLIAVWFGTAMLDNNNQGEFADVVTGEWTESFYSSIGLIVVLVAIPITGFFALVGLVFRPTHQRDESADQ